MFENIEKKELTIWHRINCLEIMKIALRLYKITNDRRFEDYAEWFGRQSIELKS